MRFQIPETGIEILDPARLVQYASLDLDLADAVNVALAAQYRTDAVLTLDRRDFRAMRCSADTPSSSPTCPGVCARCASLGRTSFGSRAGPRSLGS
jgi:hypothetical protein